MKNGAWLKHLGLLSAIMVVSVLFRTLNLSKESLWLDEAYSVHAASQPLAEVARADPRNPPAYLLALHFWLKVFGTSEAGARSLSIVPSVVALILTYFLGSRLYDEQTGLVAAAFMAVSTFHIYFAQEARCFAMLLALLVASSLIMDAILKPDGQNRRMWIWGLYVLVTTVALYTHFYAVFFVAAQSVFFVLRWCETRRLAGQWVMAQVLIFLLFVPSLLAMISEAGTGQERMHLLLKVPQTLFTFLAGYTLIPLDEAARQNVPATLKAYGHFVALASIAFILLFVAAVAAAKRYRRATAFVAAMGLGPMAMAFVISVRLQIFTDRYLIACSPFLYLHLASGVTFAFSKNGRANHLRPAAAAAALLVAALALHSLANYHWGLFNDRFGREQWREVATYVENLARSDDIIVFHPGFVGCPYDYYRLREDVARLRLKDRAVHETSDEWVSALAEIAEHRRVWLICSHCPQDNIVRRRLGAIFDEKLHEHFPKAKGIDVYLLER